MTPTVLVCDASVALAWLLGEQVATWVGELWDDVGEGSVRLSVPTHFWLEVGNTLAGRGDLADEQALEGLLRLEALGLASVEIDAPMRLRALELARRHRLTTYDAAYLALADALHAPLATLERRLRDAAARIGRLHAAGGPPRVSEPTAAYGRAGGPDDVSLAALGTHLSELRRLAAMG